MSSNSSRSFEISGTVDRVDEGRWAEARAREDVRWRNARLIGFAGTVLIHFLLLILFRVSVVPLPSSSGAAGPAAGDVQAAAGGGGGSGLTMIAVRAVAPSPPREEVTVPVPVPEPADVVVEPVEVEPIPLPDEEISVGVPSLPGIAASGTGGGTGSASGPGTATGTGRGGGGTGDQGAADIIPPRPRGIFIPPSGRPDSARGQEITVWVFVRENGRVDRETVRLEPPTSDSRYNDKLVDSVAEWVFDPARQAGRTVPAWYPFQVIL